MKNSIQKPVAPRETHETTRHAIIAELAQGACSARDISTAVGISEREVAVHLAHIQKTIASSGRQLTTVPAECKKCGFVFVKREKLKRPGKCPVCKGQSIQSPLFVIREKG